jgi:hypothetical protein
LLEWARSRVTSPNRTLGLEGSRAARAILFVIRATRASLRSASTSTRSRVVGGLNQGPRNRPDVRFDAECVRHVHDRERPLASGATTYASSASSSAKVGPICFCACTSRSFRAPSGKSDVQSYEQDVVPSAAITKLAATL